MPSWPHCTVPDAGWIGSGWHSSRFRTTWARRAYEEICSVCWAEWLKTQQQLINHYGLNLREPKAKEFLFKNMEQFLFAAPKLDS